MKRGPNEKNSLWDYSCLLNGYPQKCICRFFFGYLWYEFRYLVGTPLLEISSPKEQETLAVSTLEVVGKTNPEAKVLINNQEVSVDSNGNFSAEIKLTESMNKLTVTATSKFGKTSELERVVYFNP